MPKRSFYKHREAPMLAVRRQLTSTATPAVAFLLLPKGSAPYSFQHLTTFAVYGSGLMA